MTPVFQRLSGLILAFCAGMTGCAGQQQLSLPDTGVKEDSEWVAESFEGRVGEPLEKAPGKAGAGPGVPTRDITARPAPETSTLPYLTPSLQLPRPVVEKRLPEEGAWLRKKRVTIVQSEPIPAPEALKMLYAEGINIATTVPLENYLYAGFGIDNVRADIALRMILGSMGLDYDTDDENRVITILPMPSKTWYLTLGNRTATYISSSSSSGSSEDGGVSNSGERSVSVQEDLWARLGKELEVRMKIMLLDPGQTDDAGGETAQGDETDPYSDPYSAKDIRYNQGEFSFAEKVIGRFSLNPETGAVFVQAPQWILDGLDTYIGRIRNQYDTVIGFQGQVLLVTTTQEKSEGLDLAAFGDFLSSNGLSFAWSHNPLGGITITEPTENSAVNVTLDDPDQIGTTRAGLVNSSNSLRVFNNYLSSFGKVTVAQRPMISTTSGIPAEVSKFQVRYYNTVTQTTSTGDSGAAALGTENTLVPVEFGTLLRILPHYDPDKDIVRTRVVLQQKLNAGTQEQKQFLTLTAREGFREVITEIPIVTHLDISGELLLRDGDLVVVGGQTEHTESDDDAGIMGTEKNRWLSPVTRTKKRSGQVSTYFFALRVNVLRR
ncbi:MAG: type II and III secretion system protein [Candidatus Kentron sp. G]|nr:MAG: type II and III secretion system protein [Candidatus Kentron sp. G]VFN03711.1 MAG: type II and III secretion system protein [Candidatus Kentron sp. G]